MLTAHENPQINRLKYFYKNTLSAKKFPINFKR